MAVTTQPKVSREDVENILKNLDVTDIKKWSEEDVTQNFLRPLGYDYCSKIFEQNKINGVVLIAIQEPHLKELNALCVGDRILMMEYLEILKKKKKQIERSRTLWQADTPPKKYAYSDNFCQWCFWYCCPCLVYRTMWRITPQGIRHRRPKPFGEAEQGFIDFRFLKDLEIRTHKKCCFCCPWHELILYADDASTDRKSGDESKAPEEEITIRHPDAHQLEDIIRNAWSDVKLVAD